MASLSDKVHKHAILRPKRSFDICYTIEENTHKRGEVQLQIEDIKPSEE